MKKAKPGRPKVTQDTVIRSFQLEKEILQKMEAEAEDKEISAAMLLRRILAERYL